MALSEHLRTPDPHLDPVVAAAYDGPAHELFSEPTLGATVRVLAELASEGTAVESAVGRLAEAERTVIPHCCERARTP